MAPIAPLKMLVTPAAKAIARLSDSLTYDDVPCVVDERTDSCPYRATSPTLRLSSLLTPSTASSNPRCSKRRAARSITVLVQSDLSPLRQRRDYRHCGRGAI